MSGSWRRVTRKRAGVVVSTAVVFIAAGTYAANKGFDNPDTSPPVVRITSPTSGSDLSGTAHLTLTCKDNVGCHNVQFNIDGSPVGGGILFSIDTPTSYATEWATSGTTDGTYTLTGVASDAAGNTTTSTSRTVNVANNVGNEFVSATGNDSGGGCVRHSSGIAPPVDLTSVCLTFGKACSIAHDGDRIIVTPGSYGTQGIAASQCDPAATRTFACSTHLGCVLNVLFLGVFNSALAPSYLTFDGFDMATFAAQYDCHGEGQPDCNHDPTTTASHITLENNWIHGWNRCNTGGSCPLLGCCATHFTVINNEIGPACCSGDGVETGADNQFTFSGNYVHDLYDSCTARGMNRYGSECQGTGFADDPNAGYDHVDGMQLEGGTDLVITGNRFYNAGLQGIFLENAFGFGYDNVTVSNNMVGAVCNGQCGQEVTFGSNASGGIAGTIIYAYNTVDGELSMGGGNSSEDFADGASVTWVGNIASSPCTKVGITGCSPCTLGSPGGTFMPTFSHNEFPATTCGDSNSILGSASFVSASPLTPDLHLNGAQAAIDGGEAVYCGPGKTVSSDLDGESRPQGPACDIGADEAG